MGKSNNSRRGIRASNKEWRSTDGKGAERSAVRSYQARSGNGTNDYVMGVKDLIKKYN